MKIDDSMVDRAVRAHSMANWVFDKDSDRMRAALEEATRGFVMVPRDLIESAMQSLYVASNGKENIYAATAHEFRDLLAADDSKDQT